MAIFRLSPVLSLLSVLVAIVSAEPRRHHGGYDPILREKVAECEPVGYQFCDPYDPVMYFTCAPEGWVPQPCAPGTVCRPNPNKSWPPTIICDWPEIYRQ